MAKNTTTVENTVLENQTKTCVCGHPVDDHEVECRRCDCPGFNDYSREMMMMEGNIPSPVTMGWNAIRTDRIPMYLTAAGLAVIGVLDPPILVGGVLFYEALRRFGNDVAERE